MRKIAVTGGLSTGKSTVCRLLQEQGAYIVDADAIVHQLLTTNSSVGKQVIKLLGPEIITGNQIDRKKISKIVFSNPSKLKALEAIVHPAVRQEINRRFEMASSHGGYKMFVAEVPLLFEAGMEDDFDAVITVVADIQVARQRFPDQEEFDRRSRARTVKPTKAADGHYVLNNQKDLAALKAEVAALIAKLKV